MSSASPEKISLCVVDSQKTAASSTSVGGDKTPEIIELQSLDVNSTKSGRDSLNIPKIGSPDDNNSRRVSSQDTPLINTTPGKPFTKFADVVVESPLNLDPRLGTITELRHYIKIGSKNKLKKFLRQNNWTVGHRIRAILWSEITMSKEYSANSQLYKETIAKLERNNAEIRPPKYLSTPSLVQCTHQLNSDGIRALNRILAAIDHARPDLTCIPIIHPLSAAFLHYIENEEDVFCSVLSLIKSDQTHLLQTEASATASIATISLLTKKFKKKSYKKLKRITGKANEMETIPIFEDWKSWIFRDLPFEHLARIIDCFLCEGQKVLFRVALAILGLWLKNPNPGSFRSSNKTGTVSAAADDIARFVRNIPATPAVLLKEAFAIRNLQMSTILQIHREKAMKIGPTSRRSEHNFQSLTAQAAAEQSFQIESGFLARDEVSSILSWIPVRFQTLNAQKLFSMEKQGVSFARFWHKIESQFPTIVVLKTERGEIFGAFCTDQWLLRKSPDRAKRKYWGTGECFLFVLRPQKIHYPWVGHEKQDKTETREEMFQAGGDTWFSIGGGSGEGLFVGGLEGGDLSKGFSNRCDTFMNDPLSSEMEFGIQDLEVIGFLTEEQLEDFHFREEEEIREREENARIEY